MLLPQNTNPAYSTYYYGAIVLNTLLGIKKRMVNFIDLFREVNDRKKISIQSFVLALDWLYLIGAISKNVKGDIRLVDKIKSEDSIRQFYKLLISDSNYMGKLVLTFLDDDPEHLTDEGSENKSENNLEYLKNVSKIS